jgi:hypothetical protein
MTKEQLIDRLEAYADSIDDDINTINNYDMTCCDDREVETLREVFNFLERLLKAAT